MNRIIFVGDIHGCYDDFMKLLKKVNYSPNDLIIATGDLVDRGEKSKEVIEFFIKNGNALSVMGNHEFKHINGLITKNQEATKLMMGDFYTKALEYMKTLPHYIETEKFVVFHYATIPWMKINDVYEKYPQLLTGSGSSNKKRYVLYKFFPDGKWWKYYTGNKLIIFGHISIYENGKRIYRLSENVYALDGSCVSDDGELVALIYPDMKIVTVKCSCNMSKIMKKYVQVYKKKIFHFSGWREIEMAIEDKEYPEWFRNKLGIMMKDIVNCSMKMKNDRFYRKFPPLKFVSLCVKELNDVPKYFKNLEDWIFSKNENKINNPR